MDLQNINRLGAFVLTAALMAGLEIARPRKRPDPDRMGRWVGNLDAVAVSFVSPGPVWKIRPRRPARASLLESSSATHFQNRGAPRISIALHTPTQTRPLMARRFTW